MAPSRRQPSEPAVSSAPPEAVADLLQQALSCLEARRFADAAAIYQEVLRYAPDNIHACFNLGVIRQSDGELPAAITCYRAVLAQEPDNFQVLHHLANAYRDQGCWEAAATIYQRALNQDANHADIHFSLGLVRYHQGDLPAAQRSYREAISLDQSRAETFYNLGVIHFELGALAQAVDCYEQALARQPDDLDTHYNLAVTMTGQERFTAAAEHYRQALIIDPEDPELHNALGLLCKRLHDLPRAEACYRQALALRPDYGAAWTNLAVVLHMAGRIEPAIACYTRAIELGHKPESAAYMVAALTGADQQSAPRDYVRNLFDSYAEKFDKSLTRDLGYNSPELLREMAGKLLDPHRRFHRIADLGCGTGLIGSRFRDIAKHILGVDLSEKMLAKAAAKGVYDELHCGDIVEFLDGYAGVFDLIVAADVLIYLGELAPFFAAVHPRLAAGSHLLLTIEKLQGPGERGLQPSGRYAYSEEYLLKMADQHGFSRAACQGINLRKEQGRWLQGSLVVLRRD